LKFNRFHEMTAELSGPAANRGCANQAHVHPHIVSIGKW
jgi:hypothetical protein